MAKNYDKEHILADWKTGGYNIRELAHKHNISRGTIGPIVKGVAKELSDTVDRAINVNQEIRALSDKNGQAVREVSNREIEKRIKAEKIDDFLDSAVGIAAKKGVEILQKSDITMIEIEQFSKAQNNLRIGLKTQDKFSQGGTVINNTNAQQTNTQEPSVQQDIYNRLFN